MRHRPSKDEQTRQIREWANVAIRTTASSWKIGYLKRWAALRSFWSVRTFRAMTLPVCSPEDVIVHKIIADSPKDWADVEGVLIEQHNRLDQTHIHTRHEQFAEILERSDWLDRYETLVRRFRA